MKYFGVVYDVGLRFTPGEPYSVEPFDPALAAHDMQAIASRLSANAVRIEGEEIDRLVTAARSAHAEGLAVFFNPWKMNAPAHELADYFAEGARAAEALRQQGVDITFVAGCECTLFNAGIFPGETLSERIAWLSAQFTSEDGPATFAEKSIELNRILARLVETIRGEFLGPVTYSAGLWETVDWSLFDVVGADYYRHGETPEEYVAGLDRYRHGKPLVVMEVGSCTYEGAAALGAGGFMRLEGVDPDGSGRFVDGMVPIRSETEQAGYVGEQLELLSGAGVDGVFIYVFSFPTYPTGEGARDLDMMSFALVKTFPKDDPRSRMMPPWVEKEAFQRVAEFYRGHTTGAASA